MSLPLWLPGAIRRPIAPGANDPQIVPVGDVFHVAVSEASSLFDFFDHNPSGIEATGYIRRDGTVEQYRPITVQCDAQAAGNSWSEGGRLVGLNSWETQGMGAGEWTPEQVDTIKRIIVWKHQAWGVPLRVCPSPTSAGFGYHRLFTAWNPHHHACPGPDRVKQFEQIIVPFLGTAEGMSDVDWTDPLPKVNVPEDKDKTDTLDAGKQLAQARGFAAASYASALRCEHAIRALAKALGPQVEKSVAAALADAVIDVNVNIGNKEGTP